MSLTEENVSKILSTLSHPLRRQIILFLNEEKKSSFTDLATAMDVDTGKLSFHLRTLTDFLEQTPNGKYELSEKGKNAIILIKDLEEWTQTTIDTNKTNRHDIKPSNRVTASLIDFVLIQLFMFLAFQLSMLDLNFLFFLGVFWLYLTLFEGFSGQSLGKLLLGLKVVGINGNKISYDQAAIRNLGKVFLLPIDLFFGYKLHDKRYWRFFEKFTQTTLINITKQKQPKPIQNQNPNKPKNNKKVDQQQTIKETIN